MKADDANHYRHLLDHDPPTFIDRVDTPWDQIPDLRSYNATAYKQISRDLARLATDGQSMRAARNTQLSSRGVLVLGEAGTGKTHLLMRLAQTLAESNHILFIRRPNNEEAIAQHIWANIVNSLTRTIGDNKRSQIDDLLAHVFTEVLVPEFELDIQNGTEVEQRRRWVRKLRENSYNLFDMLGEGERRSENMRALGGARFVTFRSIIPTSIN
jgi:hypothetical protein